MNDYLSKMTGLYRSVLSLSQSDYNIDIETIAVDIHGHWLPGVDDGAKTLGEAMAIIRGLEEMGFKRVIATPHINKRMYDNDPSLLIRKYFEVVDAMLNTELTISLGLAAEYMLDSGFQSHLEGKEFLSLDDRFVLVELPTRPEWTYLIEVLYDIHRLGYKPLLAHPERYSFLQNSRNGYIRLKEAGCSFQLNMLSLIGVYGDVVRKTANRLTQRGWYEFVGTDIHSPKQLGLLQDVVLTGDFQNGIFL